MKMRFKTPKFEMDTLALEALTVDIDTVQRVIHNLQIDPRILARFFFFRTFWISMHFAPVPLLPSLPAQLQLHPMRQRCTRHAATAIS